MFTISKSPFAAAAVLALLAPVAHAGGYTAPVEPVPVIAPVTTAPAPWAGAYAGGSLGYSFGADDEIGWETFEGDMSVARGTKLGQVDLTGPTAGLQVGYRWQRNNWVFGPELWAEMGSVDDTDSVVYTDSYIFEGENVELDLSGDVESKVNHILGLQFKTGYLTSPNTMVYGTAGLVRGDFEYKVSQDGASRTEGYTANGYSLGLGVERKLNARTSVFAEWQYRNFGKTDVNFNNDDDSAFRTVATPEHHNIKLGLNFSF